MVNNVRLSGHESTFDVQRLVYYYRILIGSLYYYYSFYMPHCLIAPPYSPQFLLYAAYNAIADTLGCRISQEGRQGPYVICPLFLFFSPLLCAGKKRHLDVVIDAHCKAIAFPGMIRFSIYIHTTALPGLGSLCLVALLSLHRQRLLIRFRADRQRVAGTEKKKKTTPTFRRAGRPVKFAHFAPALRLDSYLQIAALVDLVTVR